MGLGRIFGKTSTSKFRFLAEGKVKKWDYVVIDHSSAGPVLAQVIELEKQDARTVAECTIIGYRTERGFLRQPRTPIEPNSEVLPAEDTFIVKAIGLKKKGLYLGLLEGKDSLKAYIDPEKLITKHLAVIAKSGSGKSYAVAVLLEELIEYGVPIVVIDPHGEYSSIKNPNPAKEDQKYFKYFGVQARGYAARVKEYAINTEINPSALQLKLPIPQDPVALVDALPFKVTNAQKGLLFAVINDLKDKKTQYGFEDVLQELEFVESNAKWNLINGITNLHKTRLFSFSPTSAAELVKTGQLTIINLKGANQELMEIAAQSIIASLFDYRKLGNVPPFFMVVEEAHNFCPERGFGEAKSSRVLRAVASEGRKFGLGMAIVSQRPSRVDKSVLSQCTSQMALQVSNPSDLKAIAASFEGINTETEREIKSLPIGKVLLIGASDYPLFVDVRVRKSQHGGRAESFDFSKKVEDVQSHGLSRFLPKISKAISKQEVATQSQKERSDMINVFRPRVSQKDIVMMENRKITGIDVILHPVLVVNCQVASNIYQVVFSLNKDRVFALNEKLSWTDLPRKVGNLSPMQRKVFNAVAKKPKITIAELFVETGLGFNEVGGVVDSLKTQGLVNTDGKHVSLVSSSSHMFDLSKLNFLDKPAYSEVAGTKLSATGSQDSILKLVGYFGAKVTNHKEAYIPFYKVKFEDGKEKTVDGIGYSLEA